MHRPLLVFFALAAVACDPAQTPDSSVKGNVPLLISNESDARLCAVSVENRPNYKVWNLLHPEGQSGYIGSGNRIAEEHPLDKGAQKEARMAALGMRAFVEACGDSYPRQSIKLDMSHPVFLRVVDSKKPPASPKPVPDGYTEQLVTLTFTVQNRGPAAKTACLPDGARRGDTTLPFCCHREVMPGNQQTAYCAPP